MNKNRLQADSSVKGKKQLSAFFPILSWARTYKRDDLISDLIAGLIVAIMLVPQSMAYALLAGLPPQVGLYASIAPLIIYGMMGTSRTLAVGPVALVSLLVASGITPLVELAELPAPDHEVYYVQLALTLALLVGVIQFIMGIVRLGFLVNFLSHPVLSGFINAAAIVIGFSQLKHLLGFSVPRLEFFYETVLYTGEHLWETNLVTVAIGVLSLGILLYFKFKISQLLAHLPIPKLLAITLAKSGPLIVVLLGTLLVWGGQLEENAAIKIVGEVPSGLPPLTMPLFDLSVWQSLLPTALVISFVGYVQTLSVAQSLASKRNEKIDANQELVALGVANFGAVLTGGYPVTGGFSRSFVNFTAGARSGLASIFTALLIAFTLLFLTPLFYFLPKAVLGAIILVAVVGLIDTQIWRHLWDYNKPDAISLIITFLAILAIGIERGILLGMLTSIILYIWCTSRPQVTIVGQLGNSTLYCNALRYKVQTWPGVVAVRVDGNLYFASAKYLEDSLLRIINENARVKNIVLVGTGINFIDASALETLKGLKHELHQIGIELHLADFKKTVMDRLQAIGFVDSFGKDHIYFSTYHAMKALGCTN